MIFRTNIPYGGSINSQGRCEALVEVDGGVAMFVYTPGEFVATNDETAVDSLTEQGIVGAAYDRSPGLIHHDLSNLPLAVVDPPPEEP